MVSLHYLILSDYTIDDKKVKATLQLQLEKLPTVLVINLKRFAYHDGSTIKLKKYIKFPRVLKLDESYITQNLVKRKSYRLFGVVVHRGMQADSGHYICYILDSADKWTCFNDKKVTEVYEEEVLDSQAYVLLYELIVN